MAVRLGFSGAAGKKRELKPGTLGPYVAFAFNAL